MRLYKKKRGEKDLFNRIFGFTTGAWSPRECDIEPYDLGSYDVLKWGPLLEVHAKEKTFNAVCDLKKMTISAEVREESELPADVASHLGNSSFKFYTFALQDMKQPALKPLEFGYVDQDMLENFRERVAQAIEKANE
jgi:hypothetical protein